MFPAFALDAPQVAPSTKIPTINRRERGDPGPWPNWLPSQVAHPAMVFVGACLIWYPHSVSPGLVLGGRLAPVWLPFDPRDERNGPEAVRWRQTAEHLVAALDRLVDAGALAPNERTRIVREARGAGQLAGRPIIPNRDEYSTNGWWCVPLLPETTGADWRDAAGEIQRTCEGVFGDDPVRDHAQRLAADGMTVPAIAKLLGISDDQARRHIAKR